MTHPDTISSAAEISDGALRTYMRERGLARDSAKLELGEFMPAAKYVGPHHDSGTVRYRYRNRAAGVDLTFYVADDGTVTRINLRGFLAGGHARNNRNR